MPELVTHPRPQGPAPKVLLVGGEDVDARLDLMRGLADGYTLAAAGPTPRLAGAFAGAGFAYFPYPSVAGCNPVRDLRALYGLWRVVRRFRPQVVHAFDAKPGVYGCLAAALAGVPVVVVTVPGLGSLYVGEQLTRRVLRGVYENLQRVASHVADLTTFQNEDDLREFVARGVVPSRRAAVIPGSGVRTDHLKPDSVPAAERARARAALGVPADALLVTMVGRVMRTKGVAEFIAAAREVRQRLPGAHFLLVGPADENSVDRLTPAELADVAGAVNWPGPRRDVPSVLAASDLFVLPSYLREGIPRVLLEAAAMGLPIVTTDVPGCKEVVEEGVNGFLVPGRDAAALTRAILRLAGDAELRRRFGEQSRRRAVTLFDLSVVVGQTRSLYQELLARKVAALGVAV